MYMKIYVHIAHYIHVGKVVAEEEREPRTQTQQTGHRKYKHGMNMTLRCPALRTGTVG